MLPVSAARRSCSQARLRGRSGPALLAWRISDLRLIFVPGPTQREPLGAVRIEKSPRSIPAASTRRCRRRTKIASQPRPERAAAPDHRGGQFSARRPQANARRHAALAGDRAHRRSRYLLRFEDGGSRCRPRCAIAPKPNVWPWDTLTRAEWEHLSMAKTTVMFPATGRQWVLLDLAAGGLSGGHCRVGTRRDFAAIVAGVIGFRISSGRYRHRADGDELKAFMPAHMGHIDRSHRIVGDDEQVRTGRGAADMTPREKRGQRAFQPGRSRRFGIIHSP